MDNQDLKGSLHALKKVSSNFKDSPEKARAFLQKAGIVTKSGKLTKKYSKVA